ncbi:hypothetical protein K435DRAFT_676785 [Dendrothele bispora CBS 962.96]|uniref:F-box domain-containing protein n=1 Tax=Dendrothele bispora (strain CBS 962.96) TaxID=1314807 RepID=A0A4S8LL51_DENBC|nr:hypothetical protein K435DRAFT_676785 [Dendrothele bispora CBS 962.96]
MAPGSFHLPPELWIKVFHWATCNPDAYSLEYQPFQSLSSHYTVDPLNLQVRTTLGLVCRKWHELSVEFLYKDIQIGVGQSKLRQNLHNGNGNYGKYVRRVVLPLSSTTTPTWNSKPLLPLDIIKCCDNLEVLSRPRSYDDLEFEFDVDSILLPSLKKLQWDYEPIAEQSGGINSLGTTLLSAPHLRYLSIRGAPDYHLLQHGPKTSLKSLKTLVISTATGPLINQIAYQWYLPSLTHLVVGAIHTTDLLCIWEIYKNQLEVLELGENPSFLTQDIISAALRMCPTIKTINYYPIVTLPPQENSGFHSVTTIGLNCGCSMTFPDESVCTYLEKHCQRVFFSGIFPCLQTVHFFGSWAHVMKQYNFGRLVTQLEQHGYQILFHF